MTSSRSLITTRLLLLPAAALLAAPLVGCGTDDTDTAATEGAVTVADAWVKATEGDMTGSFGVISNPGDTDLTVVSATTSASDRTELHEVVMIDGAMKMQEKDGGFVVPAGGEHVLEPGADHVMVMNLQEPIAAGDSIDVTLVLDDGSEVTYSAQAREAEVGDEEYVPSETMDAGMEGEGS
jgi:periplasmic copper chaperone A